MTQKQRAATLTLEKFLPYSLVTIAERVSRAFSEIYSEQFDISIPEWRVIAWLGQKTELTARDICQLTMMDKARVSRAVKTLHEKGHISQQRDSRDSRLRYLRLTRKGQALYQRIVPLALEWEGGLRESISAEEYRQLMAILGKLDAGLDRLGGAGRRNL